MKTSRGSWLTLATWLLVFLVALAMLIQTSTLAYSPDSWSFVDIAMHLIDLDDGVGAVNGTRDFSNVPWVNDSFPFLWPLALIPGIMVLGPAAPIGGYLFILIWVATCVVMTGTAKALGLRGFIGPLAGMALLITPGFASEGHAGRSIPLNVLLIVSAIWVLLAMVRKPTTARALLLGVLLGLAAANRFDALAYGPLFILSALAFRFIKNREALIASLSWLFFPLIWAAYSVTHLGGLYTNESSRLALSATKIYPNFWFSGDVAAPLDFWGMAGRMLMGVAALSDTLKMSLIFLGLGVLAVALGGAIVRLEISGALAVLQGNREKVFVDVSRFRIWLLSLLLLLASTQLIALIITGYGDPRYWGVSSAVIIEILLCTVAINQRLNPAATSRKKEMSSTAAVVMLVILSSSGLANSAREYRNSGDQTALDAQLVSCLRELDGVAIAPGLAAYRIAATTELRVSAPPGNAGSLTETDWDELTSTYDLSFWAMTGDPDESAMPQAAQKTLTQVDCNSKLTP